MTAPAPRPSERETAERVSAQLSDALTHNEEVSLIEAALTEARRAAIEEALSKCPPTAENPNESSYERGRFDAIMEYDMAIRRLRSLASPPPGKGADK